MATFEDVQTWKGMKAVDPDGDKIGTIEDVFLDRQTGEPEWATVKTGLFGLKSSFVPLRGAEMLDDDTVRIPADKELVKEAPKVDADQDLTEEEERRLWEHYGRRDYDEWRGEDQTAGLTELKEEDALAPDVVRVRLRRVVIVPVPGLPER
jgi:sporulation protein YlmC with PRC-barrel domain